MPVVVSGTAMVLAASMACLKASTEVTSSFTVPAGTATPNGTRARSTSDPAAILFAAISSPRPSLERITASAETPRASCAAIVRGPAPCDEPDRVVTLIRLVRSNSGSSRSYAPPNPPEIKTVTAFILPFPLFERPLAKSRLQLGFAAGEIGEPQSAMPR